MPGGSFRRRDGRREKPYDVHRLGPRPKTLQERLQRVVSSPKPYASTEVSKKEAAIVLDTMNWRERKEREDQEEHEPSILSLSTSKLGRSYRAKKRRTRYSRFVSAGCDVCEPTLAVMWRNVGSAARHHDATGHPTWSESHVKVWYGVEEEIPKSKLKLGPIEGDDDDDNDEIDVNADLYALLDENEST